MAELIVKLGEQVLQTCQISGPLLRVGRSRENDVVLENLSVSRQHLQIRLHEGRYVVFDMNSANGTYLNGTRITRRDLLDGDQITVGKHRLVFRDAADLATVVDTSGLPPLPDEPAQSASRRRRKSNATPAEARPRAWFSVESGRLKGRDFKIVRFETTIGKAASNDVVLTDDWLIGKKQAIILRKGDCEYEIQDLGGIRKVKINGRAIDEKADLKQGDVVEIGGTKLTFHLEKTKDAGRKAGMSTAALKSAAPAENSSAANGAQNHSAAASANADNDSLDLEHHFEPAAGALATAAAANINDNAPHPASAPAPANHPEMPTVANMPSVNLPVNASNGSTPKQSAAISHEELPPGVDPKEVAMWESALQSPSAAIRRQAARTLKKLTGREYDF